MQRWHVTAGLVALTLAGVALAPRLSAALAVSLPPTDPVPPVPAHQLPPEPLGVSVRAPLEPPQPAAPPVQRSRNGHLIVDAGLDRTAVLEGRREERFLTITVSAPADIGQQTRRPVDVAVVLDVSGSMNSRGKLDYAKQAAKVLAGAMRTGDTYSLVAFSDDAQVIIPAGPVPNVAAIHRAIDRIEASGSTNLYAGLEVGGAQAVGALDSENVGRVIVLSDGKTNVGRTDSQSLARVVSGLASQGITTSTVGLGLDFDEDRMTYLADLGGGSYDFVDDPRQLGSAFADELERTATVVARRTMVDVVLPPGVEGLEILGWQAQRTAEGWRLPLGDVHAGETRKIVARVRVTGSPDAGSMGVADVRASYQDLVDDRMATSRASASARIVEDEQIVYQSVDPRRARAASQAWGNHQLQLSARAYASGDAAGASSYASNGAAVLRQAAVDFDDAELAAEAEDAETANDVILNNAPSSDAGKRAIKQSKEWAYDRTR